MDSDEEEDCLVVYVFDPHLIGFCGDDCCALVEELNDILQKDLIQFKIYIVKTEESRWRFN